MKPPDDTLSLDYRPPPRRQAWLSPEKLAETLVGLSWTLCGLAALLTGLAWLFVRLEPIYSPWQAFAAICLTINTLSVVLGLGSLLLKATYDRMLLTILVLGLLIGLAAYGFTWGLIRTGLANQPRPATMPAPLFPPDATEADEAEVSEAPPASL